MSQFRAGKVATLSPAVFGTRVRVAEIRNERLRIVHGSVPTLTVPIFACTARRALDGGSD